MNRPIKFRAWIPEIKKMREVISIEFNDGDEDVYTRVPVVLVWDHESARAAKIKGRVARYPMPDVELMQFTGLLDKNKKEIYEGDLARTDAFADGHSLPVIFREGMFLLGEHGFSPITAYSKQLEVIGNVFENSELLRQQAAGEG